MRWKTDIFLPAFYYKSVTKCDHFHSDKGYDRSVDKARFRLSALSKNILQAIFSSLFPVQKHIPFSKVYLPQRVWL